MKRYSCPSCGAEVTFQSSLSVYAVCRYCRSMIVRHDVDVESIGTMASLPDDMSPLQIGSEGVYKEQRFTIIGRLKIGWKDGAWNEWFLHLDDGRKGWLAEAQGSFAFSFEVDDDSLQRTLNSQLAVDETQGAATFGQSTADPLLGVYITLLDRQLKVVDIKRATCLGSEGELPFTAPKGRESLSIDLSGGNGEFGCIEILDGNARAFVGEYVEWDEMNCRNLRPLEGW